MCRNSSLSVRGARRLVWVRAGIGHGSAERLTTFMRNAPQAEMQCYARPVGSRGGSAGTDDERRQVSQVYVSATCPNSRSDHTSRAPRQSWTPLREVTPSHNMIRRRSPPGWPEATLRTDEQNSAARHGPAPTSANPHRSHLLSSRRWSDDGNMSTATMAAGAKCLRNPRRDQDLRETDADKHAASMWRATRGDIRCRASAARTNTSNCRRATTIVPHISARRLCNTTQSPIGTSCTRQGVLVALQRWKHREETAYPPDPRADMVRQSKGWSKGRLCTR